MSARGQDLTGTVTIRSGSLTELRRHFDQLGIRQGDHLVVHSRLLTFGRLEGGVAGVFDLLWEMVGSTGTLAFPSFTFQIGETEPYDPRTTPPYAVGALSSYALGVEGMKRTLCPIHSYAVIGSQSDALLAANPRASLGNGSCFEAMEREGFYQLLLGCTFNEGATFIHHVEALCAVRYREWVCVPRVIVRPDGEMEKIFCNYFARSNGLWQNDFETVEDILKQQYSTRVPIGSRWSSRTSLKDIRKVVENLLAHDDYALVRQKK